MGSAWSTATVAPLEDEVKALVAQAVETALKSLEESLLARMDALIQAKLAATRVTVSTSQKTD